MTKKYTQSEIDLAEATKCFLDSEATIAELTAHRTVLKSHVNTFSNPGRVCPDGHLNELRMRRCVMKTRIEKMLSDDKAAQPPTLSVVETASAATELKSPVMEFIPGQVAIAA